MNYALRPYQKEAILSIVHEWRDGNRKTLLVLPTGTGKTVCFANVAKICVEHGQRVLILAHRWELLQQAKEKIEAVAGVECALEKAEMHAVDSGAMIVVASMQTLTQESRLTQYPADAFQAVILDEAHHALSSSYRRILDHFHDAFVLGVTATAERGDKQQLGQVFDSIAYEYTMRQAVMDQYLVPIKAMTIPLKLDIRNVKIQDGDFQPTALSEALEPYLEKIAEEMEKTCKDRRTVVFLPLIRISEQFCECLKRHGFKAAEVNGRSKDRTEILEEFEKGTYDVLCNSMLLTEGWDCPPVDCIVVLRPTKVRGLYQQMVGRGTRPFKGKEDLLLLDFLWLTEKHELCHPAVLFAKSEEIGRQMTLRLESGQAEDLMECEEAVEEDIIHKRKEALARQLKEQRERQRRVLDLLEVGYLLQDTEILDYEPTFKYEYEPATEKQLAALQRFGVDTASITTKGQANILLKKLIARSEKKLSTIKQTRFLESRDFVNVSKWTFDEAAFMTDAIAKNRWQVPQGIDAKTYVPPSLKGKRRTRKRIMRKEETS